MARERSAPLKLAPVAFVLLKEASLKLALVKIALVRLESLQLVSCRSRPLRSTPLKSSEFTFTRAPTSTKVPFPVGSGTQRKPAFGKSAGQDTIPAEMISVTFALLQSEP